VTGVGRTAHGEAPAWARHCPRCGAGGFVTTDGRRHHCGECDLEYYHNMAAAVSAVVRCGDRIAFVVRAKPPGAGLLDLPGGFVDPGEDLETAVVREVFEETAMKVARPRYLFSAANTYPYRDVTYWSVDAVYEFSVSVPCEVVPNDEVQGLRWHRLDEIALDELAFDSVKKTIRRLRARAENEHEDI
jgi:NAD+ diphosphatase